MKWKETDAHPMPEGDSVLCWDAVNKVMFVGYLSGGDLIPEPPKRNPGPTPYCADWWRTLPSPPKVKR
jgi:hypothetical protein